MTGHARVRDQIPTGRVRRAGPLLGAAAHAGGEAVIDALRRRGRPAEPEDYARRAGRYVDLLGRSKGALMKAGQILSYVPFGTALPPAKPRGLSGGDGPLAGERPADGS